MEARDVLKRPDQNLLLQWLKINTFDVDTVLIKHKLKIAVEEIFDVKVDNVNIINYKPKKNVWAVTKAIQTRDV